MKLRIDTASLDPPAVRARERDPSEPLGRFLVARGLLQADELVLLEALVEVCLKRQTQPVPIAA